MLDYSMSTNGINCNLKSKDFTEQLSKVQTVVDSMYPDFIIGNDAANFISSKGGDIIQGNSGNDAYKISSNCKNTVINNFDLHCDNDIIFIDQDYSDLSLNIEPVNQSLEIHVKNFGKSVTLLNWFQNKTYRHASLRTSDGITAILPENVTQFITGSRPVAAEISLENENCNYNSKRYDLTIKQYQSVSRFTAKSDLCSYNITGNGLNNYLDPGPGNAYEYQYLEGGNGSDTYVIGVNYGKFNEINNYATDHMVDFVLLSVEYMYIETGIVGQTDDVIVKSTSTKNKVDVRIKNFLLGKDHQHIVFKSADSITFRVMPESNKKKVMIVDYTISKYSQILNAARLFPTAAVIYGSLKKKNKIYGSSLSRKLAGGSHRDIIEGGSGGEQIEGFGENDILKGNEGNDIIFGGNGNDTIFGGNGNDVIAGGYGADKIDGGDGMDSLVFEGDSIDKKGVSVSLKYGLGQGADATDDTYTSIEIVHGTNFTDILEGNDDNNILSGNGGPDHLITYKGYDVLVGGLDNDVYNLTNAEGWKIIHNYASDEAKDTVIVGDIANARPCVYSHHNDLFINIQKAKSRELNVVIKEWYTGPQFRHLRLEYKNKLGLLKRRPFSRAKKYQTSVEKWISFFKNNANMRVNRYDSKSVTVIVDSILRYIPNKKFEIFLNYVSEGKKYINIKLSGNLQKTSSRIKIEKKIVSGVMISLALSLHKCNQVLAVTLPIVQRSLPSPPSSLKLTHQSSVSLSVKWDTPRKITDPNHKYYQYLCVAMKERSPSVIIQKTITEKNTTTFLFDKLTHETKYTLRVFSVIGGEISDVAAEINAQTSSICETLEEPNHGYIRDEIIVDGIGKATVGCNKEFGLLIKHSDMEYSKVSL